MDGITGAGNWVWDNWNGSFSFAADLAQGSISNASMQGGGLLKDQWDRFVVNGFNVSGGSGSISGSGFTLGGFSGSFMLQDIPFTTIDPADTYMNGVIQTSGASVSASGAYSVGAIPLTTPFYGDFSGALGPAAPVPALTALVIGALLPNIPDSWMRSSGYSGKFSFELNLQSGVISNAAITASDPDAGGAAIYAAYQAVGGSGSMNSGNFHITGFSGSIDGPYSAEQVDSASYMTGSGNADAVGNTVSGVYRVQTDSTVFIMDQGDFLGIRTQ
jgi:hypothetical protein